MPLDAFLDADELCRLLSSLRPRLEGGAAPLNAGDGGGAMGLPPARACLVTCAADAGPT